MHTAVPLACSLKWGLLLFGALVLMLIRQGVWLNRTERRFWLRSAAVGRQEGQLVHSGCSGVLDVDFYLNRATWCR